MFTMLKILKFTASLKKRDGGMEEVKIPSVLLFLPIFRRLFLKNSSSNCRNPLVDLRVLKKLILSIFISFLIAFVVV